MQPTTKIFFDVDGVLIDGWHINPAYRKPWNDELEKDLGIETRAFEEALFHPAEGKSESLMTACALGTSDLKDTLATILPPLGYTGTIDAFLTYWFTKDSNINTAVMDLVLRLKRNDRVELYIATTQEHRRAAYLWDSLDFSTHFLRMFYSAAVGFVKNDVHFYESVNTSLNIDPAIESPLFFDDQPAVIETARSAGWNATLFNSVNELSDHPVISDLLRQSG